MSKKQTAVIAEGVTIALAAARLIVKNHILVDTIAGGENYDPNAFHEEAIEALETIAAESDKAAERLKKAQRAAFGRYSISDGTHDYRDRDVRNLRRRRKQSEFVAAQLRAMTTDPEAITELVESSREAAWADVANNLQNRLRIEAMRPESDPDYGRMREARLEALIAIDLQQLEDTARRRREAQQGQ